MMTRILAISGFLIGFALFAIVEWRARREAVAVESGTPGGKGKIPTLGELTGFVMGYEVGRIPVGRIAVFGFWWWVGWHFFAR